MDTVTVSSDYRVVIPKAIRERMGIVPGQELQVLAFGDHMHVLPIRSAQDLRGSLKGCDIGFVREETDRLL